jgi:hypothetical protein
VEAVDHPVEHPHNKDSLYYQFRFHGVHGRWPTWEDAMAHCSEKVKAVARKETPKPIIREMGVEWYDLVDRVKKAGLVDEVRRSGISEMPTSAVVGVVGLEGCERVEDVIQHCPIQEITWGDFSAGRFAWKLLHPIGPKQGFVPLVCSGRQQLWDLPAEVSRLVELQMSLFCRGLGRQGERRGGGWCPALV